MLNNGTSYYFKIAISKYFFICGVCYSSSPLVGDQTAAYAGEVVGLREIRKTYGGKNSGVWFIADVFGCLF